MPNFIKTCIDRYLPANLAIKAAHLAIEENPKNKPKNAENLNTSEELALVTDKIWKNGRTLKIAFLDGHKEVKSKVEIYAKEWCKYANLHFDFGNHARPDLRISFAEGGSWSYIGTDALSIEDMNKPTINFGWLTPESEDEEYERVVIHEFGHALGCIHEHQNPEVQIPWDVDALTAYYTGPPNDWSESDIFQNLLKKYGREVTQYSQFDKDSIMLYPIPQEHTLGDYEVGLNLGLSEGDKAFIRSIYPTG